MCSLVYFSITTPEDLRHRVSDLFKVVPVAEDDDPEISERLDHPWRWHLQGQYGGCSCHFRHVIYGGDMSFGPPEDGCPEDPDDIEATKAVYDLFVDLLTNGQAIDVLTVWASTLPTAVTTLNVSLSEVGPDSFRFAENYKFNLKA